MSHTERYRDTGPTTAYYQGVAAERERILDVLEGIRRRFALDEVPYAAILIADIMQIIEGQKIYEDDQDLTPELIVETVKQVRKEMSEERAKGDQK